MKTTANKLLMRYISFIDNSTMDRNVLIILSLLTISCRQEKPLNFFKVTGQYSSLDTADDYSSLVLRDDSTYVIDQFSGEFHLQQMGQWTIQDDTIVLFKGVEFSDSLLIKEIRDTKSDTLEINVFELQSKTSNRLRFSINNIDLKLDDGKIKINKSDFWKEGFSPGDYEYVPLSLDIRFRNGFARIPYIFTAKTLELKFRTLPTFDITPDSLLCKYYKRDSVLCSTGESYKIKRNSLKRGE